MRRVHVHRVVALAGALVLIGSTGGGARGSANVSAAVFYYPWFGTPELDGAYDHWQQNGHRPVEDVASSFYPSRGVYSSSDQSVVDAQMDEIARAGIAEIIVSWWGRGTPADARLPAVVAAAAAHGLDVAAHLEPYAGRTVARTAADIEYLRTFGIRDFFVYRAADFAAADWQPLTSSLNGVRLFAQTGLAGYAKSAGFQGLYTYDATTYGARTFGRICNAAHREGLLCAPSVAPGYSASRATDDTRVVSRRDGATYDAGWRAALHAEADLVTITSYNEWNEGTQIEPARAREGYESYDGAWGRYGTAAERAYLQRTGYWTWRLGLRQQDVGGAAVHQSAQHLRLINLPE